LSFGLTKEDILNVAEDTGSFTDTTSANQLLRPGDFTVNDSALHFPRREIYLKPAHHILTQD